MKQKIFIILSVMLMIVVCVGCVQNNAFDADTIPANDTSGNGIKDTTPVDTEPEYIEDLSEGLPSHLHKINGLYYLDLPEKAEADNTGNQLGQVAAPVVSFSTLEDMKRTVLANSFSEEQKAVLAQREGNLGRKLCIPNLNMLDKIKALSMIEQQGCAFGESICVRGVAKDNLYGNERVTLHYYNSEESWSVVLNSYLYRLFKEYEYETVEFKGASAKKIQSEKSIAFVYEFFEKDTEVIVQLMYSSDKNAMLSNSEDDSKIIILFYVKNEKNGMYFHAQMTYFEKDPSLEWILQFAEISE